MIARLRVQELLRYVLDQSHLIYQFRRGKYRPGFLSHQLGENTPVGIMECITGQMILPDWITSIIGILEDSCFDGLKGEIGLTVCWNCISTLRCGMPKEAKPQLWRWQQRRGEQRHGNGNGKGILVTTAWHSSIASFALFLLDSYILLHSIE